LKEKKIPFFIRVKKAVTDFEAYQTFAREKTRVSVKYFIKLLLLFVLITTIVTVFYTVHKFVSEVIDVFIASAPEFKFENNQLSLYEKGTFEYETTNGSVKFIVNTEEQIEPENNQVIFLKDGISMKFFGMKNQISYESLGNNRDINNMNKQYVGEYLQKNQINVYGVVFILLFIAGIIVYGYRMLFSILILSILGLIVGRISNIKIKYSEALNMAFYATTLSIFLYLGYIVTNTFVFFEIKYFDVAYDVIAYIYIITAILIMKSDLIKQKIELIKLAEIQEQMKEELERRKKEKEQERERERKEPKDKEEKKEKEKKKKGKGEEPKPEPNKA